MKGLVGLIHLAGTAQGLVQRCARCGAVLIDRRGEQHVVARGSKYRPAWFAGAVEDAGSGLTATNLAPNCGGQ